MFYCYLKISAILYFIPSSVKKTNKAHYFIMQENAYIKSCFGLKTRIKKTRTKAGIESLKVVLP